MVSVSNLILTILVGLLTSGIVAWVDSIFSKRKSRFHLQTIRKSSNIYHVRNVGDIAIQVQYKGHEVKSSLLVLRLVLENDGKQDIRFDSHFSQGVTIKSDSFSFVGAEAKESLATPLFTCGSDGSATLKWDILKTGETIDFELIAEPKEMAEGVLDEDRLFRELKFDFRSDCIDSINAAEEKAPFPIRLLSRRGLLITCSVILMGFLYVCYLGASLHFSATESKNGTEPISIGYSVLFDRYVVLGNNGIEIISPEEMTQNLVLSTTGQGRVNHVLSKVLEVLMLISFTQLLVLAILYFILQRKRRRLNARKRANGVTGVSFYL